MKNNKTLFILLPLLFSCASEAQIYPEERWARSENPSLSGWEDIERSTFNRSQITEFIRIW